MPTIISGDASSFLTRYTSVAVFLLGAFALVLPTGYSFGAALLLLGSFYLLWNSPPLRLQTRDWLILLVLLTYGLLGMIDAAWRGEGIRDMDRPLRFLLAMPILALLIAYPPRLAALWAGLGIGALGAGVWAAWQKLAENVDRAQGYTHLIQYGDLSLMMGVFCLAGLGWAVIRKRSIWWLLLLGLGTLGGILGSVFTGTRGGWIGLPIMLVILYWGYGSLLSVKGKLGVFGIMIVVAGLIYALPQTDVQHRIQRASTEIQQYFDGTNRTSSIGYRLEMWRGAWHLFQDKPLLGWGEMEYRQGMMTLAEHGVMLKRAARFHHTHNELFDTLAKRGLVGLAFMLALYLVPLVLFARYLRADSFEVRSLALAGTLLPVSYLCFGLTQSIMAHNSGVMMYAFWLVVLWGTLRATERAASAR